MSLEKIIRKCTGCNQMQGCDKLFRVCIIDDVPTIDMAHSLQARGAYVCKNAECILKAKKSRGLNRSLRRSVSDDIYDVLINNLSEE